MALILATSALPAGAGAATRFAAPNGAGPEPCAEAQPCSLAQATSGGLRAGDTVLLLAGTYSLGRSGIEVRAQNVTIADRQGPVTIQSTSRFSTLNFANAGGTLLRVTVINTCGLFPFDPDPSGCAAGSSRAAVSMNDPNLVDRVYGYSALGDACRLTGFSGSGGSVSNTACWGGGGGVVVENPRGLRLVNVTARGRTAPGVRVIVTDNPAGACAQPAQVSIVNGLLVSEGFLQTGLELVPSAGCTLEATVRSTLYLNKRTAMDGVVLSERGTVTGPATFDGAYSLVPLATSPSVNRGSTDAADVALAGIFDLAGAERVQGGRIDLGAYEYGEGVPPPGDPLPGGLGQAGGSGPAAGRPTASVLRPRARVRARSIRVSGAVVTTGAGTIVRTVGRLRGRRVVPVCRARGTAVDAQRIALACSAKPAVRRLLRRGALRLVVTTRFTPEGATQATVDRQTIRVKRRR